MRTKKTLDELMGLGSMVYEFAGILGAYVPASLDKARWLLADAAKVLPTVLQTLPERPEDFAFLLVLSVNKMDFAMTLRLVPVEVLAGLSDFPMDELLGRMTTHRGWGFLAIYHELGVWHSEVIEIETVKPN